MSCIVNGIEKKMSTLRQDMDLNAVYRRIGKMADVCKVDDQFCQQNTKLESLARQHAQVEKSLAKVIADSGNFQERLDLIYDRQAEVIVGKRNTNCLSCAEEPKNANLIGINGKVYQGTHTSNVVVDRSSPHSN